MNKKRILVKTLERLGKSFQNKSGATFIIEDAEKLAAGTLENEGKVVFEGNLSGHLQKLLNRIKEKLAVVSSHCVSSFK